MPAEKPAIDGGRGAWPAKSGTVNVMGNSEDLEEYDAELELALKREYADVFSLFRYCVITAEATYLCNKLEMDCVPHASYLLFELDMEDVWVWDRNRPTRIIPRAHVYTTADVTVEQLKEGEGADLGAALPQGVLDQLRASMFEEDEDEVVGDAEVDESETAEALPDTTQPEATSSSGSPDGAAASQSGEDEA